MYKVTTHMIITEAVPAWRVAVVQAGRYLLVAGVLCLVFGLQGIPAAQAAKLFVAPAATSAAVGATFITDVVVDTEGEVVNAASVEVAYPATLLSLREAQPTGTVFPLAPQPPRIDANRGNIMFEAGAPGGFQGQGTVLRLVWQVLRQGTAEIGFGSRTQLLRHSATADPVFLDLGRGNVTLTMRDSTQLAVTSDDHPDEATWYNVPFVRMAWQTKPGASYSYVLSRSPNEEPDEVPDQPAGSIKLATPEDGVFYFHIRECMNGSCGATVTRRAMKDATPPSVFQVLSGQQPEAYEGKRFISFAATDAASGIDHYEVAEGSNADGAWQTAPSPYVLRAQSGEVKVWVRAYDRAGNLREVAYEVAAPHGSVPRWLAIVVGIAIVVVLCMVWFRRRSLHSSATP